MRYMFIVKATKDSEAGMMPGKELLIRMGKYHEELVRAGAVLDVSGLQPNSTGWRIQCSGGKRTVIDGPFTESKELIAGYTIIQVPSREDGDGMGSALSQSRNRRSRGRDRGAPAVRTAGLSAQRSSRALS